MPQIRAMKKSLRQSQKHAERNRAWKVRGKQARRAVLDNLGQVSAEETTASLREAQKVLDKMAKRGIIHPNTAARRKAALAAKAAAQ
ncbi:MAG: 30S ribosomal protein S20 [Armatimonadetes bacterium]|nr:30S ribosomal protein S20 [Armatimonadota bacterium]